jgi:hypothetical protein
MAKAKINNFWLYDISQLFKSASLIPKSTDTLNDKLNTIMRLSIIACTVIAIYKPILALNTLLIIATLTVAIQSLPVMNLVEPFEDNCDFESHNNKVSDTDNLKIFMKEFITPNSVFPSWNTFGINSLRFCNDEVPYEYSLNGTLVGDANPKTKIPPLIPTPSYDLDWKLNDFVIRSGINARTNFDLYNSGYETSSLIPISFYHPKLSLADSGPKLSSTDAGPKLSSVDAGPKLSSADADPKLSSADAGPKLSSADAGPKLSAADAGPKLSELEGFKLLPQCETIRDNLLTQTLQPGVYQKSYIGEPIQSNIGISYTQEFVPTFVEQNSNSIKYTQFEGQPPYSEEINDTIKRPVDQNIYNVYDPRFTGYGTGYRAYIDNMERPQFFYDDINSITMPNYIVRSKIDSFPWADSYGNEETLGKNSELCCGNFRSLANNAFTDSSILFRTEMQERLMRKRNAELWQRRAFPISTMNKVSYLAR